METITGKLLGWKPFEPDIDSDDWGTYIATLISAGTGIIDVEIPAMHDYYLEYLNGSSNINDGFYCCFVSDEDIMKSVNEFYSNLAKSGAGSIGIFPGTKDAPAFKLKAPATELYYEVEIYLQVIFKVTRDKNTNIISPTLGFRIGLYNPKNVNHPLVVMRVDNDVNNFIQWRQYIQSDSGYYYKILYNKISHSTAITFGTASLPLFILSEGIRVSESTATRFDMIIFLINKVYNVESQKQTVYINVMAPDIDDATTYTHARQVPIFIGSNIVSNVSDSFIASIPCQLFGWLTRYVSRNDKFLYKGPTSTLSDFHRCRDDSGNYYVYLGGFLLYDPDR